MTFTTEKSTKQLTSMFNKEAFDGEKKQARTVERIYVDRMEQITQMFESELLHGASTEAPKGFMFWPSRKGKCFNSTITAEELTDSLRNEYLERKPLSEKDFNRLYMNEWKPEYSQTEKPLARSVRLYNEERFTDCP